MGGGLMQLVAYGAQDVYLTGNPQITLFKVVYRRHTNFSMECIELPVDTLKPSGRTTVQILRNGDLASKTYLRVVLPSIASSGSFDGKVAWVRRLGHAMIKSAEIQIGGSPIDKHWGTWLDLWYELTHQDAQARGYAQMIGDTDELTTLTSNASITGTHPLAGGQELNIPLQFWFCRNYGLALPLIALQYHEVRINLEMQDVANLVVFTNGANGASPVWSNLAYGASGLLIDYIYLDSEERRRFAQVGHEYLIEQIQLNESSLQSTGANQTITLNFNHPCKELIWAHKTGAFNGSDASTRFLAYTNTVTNGDYDNTSSKDNTWNNAITTAAQNLVASMILAAGGTAAAGGSNPTAADVSAATGLATSDFVLYDAATGAAAAGPIGTGTLQLVAVEVTAGAPLKVVTIKLTSDKSIVLNLVNTNTPTINSITSADKCFVYILRQPLVEIASPNTNLATFIQNATAYLTYSTPVGTSAPRTGTSGLTGVTVAVNSNDQTFTLEELSVPLSKFTDNRRSVSAITVSAAYSAGAANTWGRAVNDIHVVQCDNYGVRLDGKGNIVVDAKLVLNGHDRFAVRRGGYFNYVQPNQHHTHTPADGINVYSFGLHPEQHQPTGTCNMSRIDSARLVYTVADPLKNNRTAVFDYTTGTVVYIFVTNYNVLRIMSGMGGLAYSN
jgi:hypothetical protein